MTGGEGAIRDSRADGGAAGPGRVTLRVDGHAHFHPRFAVDRFLDAADRNLRPPAGGPAAGGSGPGRAPDRCLLLADPPGRDSLEALSDAAGGSPRWEIRATGEEASRVAVSSSGGAVLLVAGRQLATSEGLEVLALATDAELPPGGRPADDTVRACLAAGAVTVLPWGFGKWWFRRGRVARALVESVDHPLFFVGDNGGRPRIAPEPGLFRDALRRGTAVLAGSDPLPVDGEEERVGSYGFVLPGGVPGDAPAAGVRDRLARLGGPPATFGHRAGVGRFLSRQVRMQMRKRGPR